MRESASNEKRSLLIEIEHQRNSNIQLEGEKNELLTNYERDKVLWDGKFNFLEQQKEQAKQDLQESMRKFEQTLQHLQKARNNEKSHQEESVTEMLVSIEKKYQI